MATLVAGPTGSLARIRPLWGSMRTAGAANSTAITASSPAARWVSASVGEPDAPNDLPGARVELGDAHTVLGDPDRAGAGGHIGDRAEVGPADHPVGAQVQAEQPDGDPLGVVVALRDRPQDAVGQRDRAARQAAQPVHLVAVGVDPLDPDPVEAVDPDRALADHQARPLLILPVGQGDPGDHPADRPGAVQRLLPVGQRPGHDGRHGQDQHQHQAHLGRHRAGGARPPAQEAVIGAVLARVGRGRALVGLLEPLLDRHRRSSPCLCASSPVPRPAPPGAWPAPGWRST